MTDLPILNHTDLKNEIYRLQGLEREKGMELKKRFSSPGAILTSAMSLFSGSGNKTDAKDAGVFNQDLLGTISRFILPLALNNTIFKRSNFIVKALVGLVSQKASNLISDDAVGGVLDKAKGLFGKVTHIFDKKDKKPKPEVPSYRKISSREDQILEPGVTSLRA